MVLASDLTAEVRDQVCDRRASPIPGRSGRMWLGGNKLIELPARAKETKLLRQLALLGNRTGEVGVTMWGWGGGSVLR